MYDEESDRHVHITLEDALYAAGVHAMPAAAVEGMLYGAAGSAQRARSQAFLDGLPADRQGGFPTTIATIKTAVTAGKWVPLEIVIARPFIEHLMMSAIMTVAGRDTGATLFGPADMQISANTSVKTIEGHYTCILTPRTYAFTSSSLPRKHTGISYSTGNLWIFKNDAANLSPLKTLDGNSCFSNSALFPSASATGKTIEVRPLQQSVSKKPRAESASAGTSQLIRRRSASWTVANTKTSTSPSLYGTCFPDCFFVSFAVKDAEP